MTLVGSLCPRCGVTVVSGRVERLPEGVHFICCGFIVPWFDVRRKKDDGKIHRAPHHRAKERGAQ